MATVVERAHGSALHPVHAILLGGAVPLFLGALLSDAAYSASYQVQWTNFASWLIAGGLVFAGFALLWALAGLVRASQRERRTLLRVLLLLATWVLGFVNALVHAKDAWAVMPEGLLLSVIATALAIASAWLGFSSHRAEAAI